jgi:sugar-specific transcriptional regulator TrmB
MAEQVNSRLVTDGDQSSKDIDLLMKYVGMIGKLESEDNLYRTIEMAEDFLKWLYKKDRKEAQHYVTIYDNYIKELSARQPL